MNMLNYLQAAQLMKPACKMHDRVQGNITTSGGSNAQTFTQNSYPILVYRSVFTLFCVNQVAAPNTSVAIIQTSTARDKFTAMIELTKDKTTYNPVDVFGWNDTNTDNVNNYFWLIDDFTNFKVTLTHSPLGSVAANAVPINWEFMIQYYELRDGYSLDINSNS